MKITIEIDISREEIELLEKAVSIPVTGSAKCTFPLPPALQEISNAAAIQAAEVGEHNGST